MTCVESGGIDILNPADGHSLIVTHGPGQFAGDIDLLTRRPIIVNGVAHGPTRLMRIANSRLREVLSKVPHLGEKLMTATQERFPVGRGEADDLRADRAVDDLGDFHDQLLKRLAAFGGERRVRGDAVDEAHLVGFLDVLRFSAIDKNLHGLTLTTMAGGATRKDGG